MSELHVIVDSGGNAMRVARELPPPPMIGDSRAGAMLPFANLPYHDVSPDGAWIAYAYASVTGDSAGTLHVAIMSAAGEPVYSRQYRIRGTRIPKSVADSVIDARFRSLQQRNPDLASEFRRQAKAPDIYPPILGVVVGRDKSVWLRLRTDEQGDPAYLLLAPNGTLAGALHSPSRGRMLIMEGTFQAIWTVETDENDVPSIVQYAVRPRAR